MDKRSGEGGARAGGAQGREVAMSVYDLEEDEAGLEVEEEEVSQEEAEILEMALREVFACMCLCLWVPHHQSPTNNCRADACDGQAEGRQQHLGGGKEGGGAVGGGAMTTQNQAATESSDTTPAPCGGGGVGRGDTFSQLVKEEWNGGDTHTHTHTHKERGYSAVDTSVAARQLNAAAVSLDRQSVLHYIYAHRRQGE